MRRRRGRHAEAWCFSRCCAPGLAIAARSSVVGRLCGCSAGSACCSPPERGHWHFRRRGLASRRAGAAERAAGGMAHRVGRAGGPELLHAPLALRPRGTVQHDHQRLPAGAAHAGSSSSAQPQPRTALAGWRWAAGHAAHRQTVIAAPNRPPAPHAGHLPRAHQPRRRKRPGLLQVQRLAARGGPPPVPLLPQCAAGRLQAPWPIHRLLAPTAHAPTRTYYCRAPALPQ